MLHGETGLLVDFNLTYMRKQNMTVPSVCHMTQNVKPQTGFVLLGFRFGEGKLTVL
jgi:hypothetical protein